LPTQALRDSMQDHVIAIDLEWQPDFGAGRSRVALMQLATSTCAVLVRTCRMKYQLPPKLMEFLRWAPLLSVFTSQYVCKSQ
jgi:ribonuclease D